jgi:hypothetical protein
LKKTLDEPLQESQFRVRPVTSQQAENECGHGDQEGCHQDSVNALEKSEHRL